MALVKTIFLKLITKRIENGGTDSHVYLGIGGREFYVDSEDTSYNDFEPGDARTYIFGEQPSLVPSNSTPARYSNENDPKQPYPLETMVHLLPGQFPVYIRFEPDEDDSAPDWCLEEVEVRVNPVGESQEILYFNLKEQPYLWLGQHNGKCLGLFRTTTGT